MRAHGRDTRPRAHTYAPAIALRTCVHTGAVRAPAYVLARESSDFKGEFNYYLLRFKTFLKNSCKFLTYIELRILILKYKILRFN